MTEISGTKEAAAESSLEILGAIAKNQGAIIPAEALKNAGLAKSFIDMATAPFADSPGEKTFQFYGGIGAALLAVYEAPLALVILSAVGLGIAKDAIFGPPPPPPSLVMLPEGLAIKSGNAYMLPFAAPD